MGQAPHNRSHHVGGLLASIRSTKDQARGGGVIPPNSLSGKRQFDDILEEYEELIARMKGLDKELEKLAEEEKCPPKPIQFEVGSGITWADSSKLKSHTIKVED